MDEAKMEREKEAIRDALLAYYHRGHARYDPDLYLQILHPDWKFFQVNDGELTIVDRDEFCSWYAPDKFDPALEWKTTFDYIEITADIASVKLKLENQKICYIDYLNMIRLDGKWWIVNKLSHAIEKD